MIQGLKMMKARLNVRGGSAQQDRMIKDKRETLDRVVLYSYQGARIKKLEENASTVPALINPNVVKQDYDDKIISVGYEYNFAPGDIFEWENTNTKWIIYLQDLTELAYFKGDIRKCSYSIKWQDNNEINEVYAAVRGPTETSISSAAKSNMVLDTPNHSLTLLIPKNEKTLKYFKRYSEFYLQGIAKTDTPICWRIEGTDTISMPGIIQLHAIEYYANEHEDNIDEGLVGTIAPIIEVEDTDMIRGKTFIKPKMTEQYEYVGNEISTWKFDNKLPIEVEINDKIITITWQKTYSGQFELSYGDSVKTIVVESLF